MGEWVGGREVSLSCQFLYCGWIKALILMFMHQSVMLYTVMISIQGISGLHLKYVYSLEAIVFSVERLYLVTSSSPTFMRCLIADGTVKNWLTLSRSTISQ